MSYGDKYRSMCVYATSTIDIFRKSVSIAPMYSCFHEPIHANIGGQMCLCVRACVRISHEHTEKKSLAFVARCSLWKLNTAKEERQREIDDLAKNENKKE